MYRRKSFLLSSESRYSVVAMSWLARSSSRGFWMKMMRSWYCRGEWGGERWGGERRKGRRF